MNEIVPVDQLPDFDLVADSALKTLRDGSASVYAVAYKKWAMWCEERSINPSNLHPDLIVQFLIEQPVTMTTRKNYMSALRKFVWVLSLDFRNPAYRSLYEFLKGMPVPETGLAGRERNKVALTPGQVHRVLTFWVEPEELQAPENIANKNLRNHILLCAALALGARRAEVVKLEWRDLDIENGTVVIRHGKGDKERVAAFVGDFALTPLRQWRERIPEYQYIFVPVNKGDVIEGDRPITGNTFYRMVKDVSVEIGVDFATHDFRRSLITELLNMGANIRDIQAQAGHANEATTLRYAQSSDAHQRREKFKTRWE